MVENKKKERIEIHYYFEDNSHTMNAFIRNKMEKDLLDAINRIGLISEKELEIESEAFQEGGLKEILLTSALFLTPPLTYFNPTINDLITNYFTEDEEFTNLQKDKIKKEIELLDLEINEKKDNQKKLENVILNDKQIKRNVSSFYKRVDSYSKVVKIGYKDLDYNNKEYQVEKKDFQKFIMNEDIDVIEDDNATIEIVSPILKEGKDKWKGIYNGDKISFSMGASDFKKEVISGKHKFSNGSKVICHLIVKIIYDEFGDEKRRFYSVQKIFATIESPISEEKLTMHGIEKKRQNWNDKHQKTIFDYIEKDV